MKWFSMQRLLAVQQFLHSLFLDPGARLQLLSEGLELHILFHGPQNQNYFFIPLHQKLVFHSPLSQNTKSKYRHFVTCIFSSKFALVSTQISNKTGKNM